MSRAMPKRNGRHTTQRLRLDPFPLPHAKSPGRAPRVALYSHDTLGLGHLRRNLLIAQALHQSHLGATNLLVTGAYEANFFRLPEGADSLTLPRLHKDADGSYSAGQLDLSVRELIQLRAEAIASALATYQPDLFIVDKVAPGAFGELLPALKHLSQNGRTRCVLGIRDVLDAPHVVQNEWRESGTEALVRQYYHAIWVYGDQRLYDPVDEYQWSPTITSAVRFTGYLDQSQRLCPPNPTQSEWISQLRRAYGSVFLCTLGGGKDGYAVADAFVEAMGGRTECGVLLTGPFIPRDRFDALRLKVDRHQNLRIVNFSNEADQLVSQADGVVGMAGYNTVSSILSYHKSALLVPRVVPREEQWIRAQRLARQGIVQMVHPNELEPAAIRNWVERTRLEGLRGAPRPDHQIDLGGLRRVVDYATALITNHRSCLVTPI